MKETPGPLIHAFQSFEDRGRSKRARVLITRKWGYKRSRPALPYILKFTVSLGLNACFLKLWALGPLVDVSGFLEPWEEGLWGVSRF